MQAEMKLVIVIFFHATLLTLERHAILLDWHKQLVSLFLWRSNSLQRWGVFARFCGMSQNCTHKIPRRFAQHTRP